MKLSLWRLIFLLLGFALPASGQVPNASYVSIGTIGEFRVTLDKNADLKRRGDTTLPPTAARPIWIRTCDEDSSTPRQEGKRTWLIRYSGWKGGDYDLRDLLTWSDRFTREMLPPMIVTIVDPLPAGHQGALETIEPPKLDLALPPSLTTRQIAISGWAAGLLLLAWLGWIRKDRPVGEIGRPGDGARRRLLEAMRAGSRGPLTPQTRADLQRQFLGMLLADFVESGGTFKERLERLHQKPECDSLYTEFERWARAVEDRATPLPEKIVEYLSDTRLAAPGT